jgi:hypothetical protein
MALQCDYYYYYNYYYYCYCYYCYYCFQGCNESSLYFIELAYVGLRVDLVLCRH